MAANPSKPPAYCLNENTTNNCATTSDKILYFQNSTSSSLAHETSNNKNNNNNNSCDLDTNGTSSCNSNLNSASSSEPQQLNSTGAKARSNCHCTNISIMHLFHEMKQKFPTIPDSIVQQCVNENCHQRENCLQLLRNELAQNPIPVQSYPAKVLRNQQQQNRQLQQQQQTSQDFVVKPLKPTRAAPPQPTLGRAHNLIAHMGNNGNAVGSPGKALALDNANANFNKPNCDIVANNANQNLPQVRDGAELKAVANGVQHANDELLQPPPRTRPTTLNLHSSNASTTPQPQQRQQQLNVQVQARSTTASKPLRRAPLPPLPPKPQLHLPPYALVNGLGSHTPHISQSQQSSFSNDSSSSCVTSPLSSSSIAESEISVNVSLSSPTSAAAAAGAGAASAAAHHNNAAQLTSPKRHRSVINVQPDPPYMRDFLVTSPTTSTTTTSSNGFGPGQKSFTAVNLTLRQPSAAQSTIELSAGPGVAALPSSGLSASNGNLGNTAGGLTYSSVSYDARRGVQKNIHITVTDEASGVFTAGRIRPPRSRSANRLNAQINGISGNEGNTGRNQQAAENNAPLRSAASAEHLLQDYGGNQQALGNYNQMGGSQRTLDFDRSPRQSFDIGNKAHDDAEESPYQQQINHVISLQKDRRDMLATALRLHKKKFSVLEQELNILTDAYNPAEVAKIDKDIAELRSGFDRLFSEAEARRNGGGSSKAAPAVPSRQNSKQSPQSFPRQRTQNSSSSASSTASPLQLTATAQTVSPLRCQQLEDLSFAQQQRGTPQATTASFPAAIHQQQAQDLGFVQHHMSPTAAASAQQQNYYQQQQYLQQQSQQQHLRQPLPDDSDVVYSDSDNSADDLDDVAYDDDEGQLKMWTCQMCTFDNHPQLNICEQCDCVRILPGTIRIVRNASDNSVLNNLSASASASSLAPNSASALNNNAALARSSSNNTGLSNAAASLASLRL